MTLATTITRALLLSTTVVAIACGGATTGADPPAAAPGASPDQNDDQPGAEAGPSEPAAAAEPAEPPCQGTDCFGDYQPKTSPGTLPDYAPEVIAKVDALARAGIEGLPELIYALKDANKNAKANPGKFREGNVILGADPQEYVPSEQELIASEIGDRIAAIVAESNIGQLEFALEQPGIKDIKISYGKIRVWHVDVMGSGRFYYAAAPQTKVVQLLPQKN